MKTEIKLKLKVKDIEIELSKNEVKELQAILNELFPTAEKIIERTVPYYPTVPITPYYSTFPYYWVYPTGEDTTPTVTWCDVISGSK